MNALTGSSYPGSNASDREVFELATAYYNAANVLFKNAEKLGGLSYAQLDYAPARMCAMHAIELYLNAFLLHEGTPHKQIRARMHNLADPTFVTKLKLKKKTDEHLQEISSRREYLISRYAPDQMSQHTEPSRLTATLKEVGKKVHKHLESTDSGRRS